jgi:hypothetical protein
MDLPGANENLRALKQRFPSIETVPISAARSEGLPDLTDHLKRWLFQENPGNQEKTETPMAEAVACE